MGTKSQSQALNTQDFGVRGLFESSHPAPKRQAESAKTYPQAQAVDFRACSVQIESEQRSDFLFQRAFESEKCVTLFGKRSK